MKNIRIFPILISILISQLSFSQDWIKTYTSTTGSGYIAHSVCEAYDKGYVILGDAFNYKYGLIIKTDINGSLIWQKLIGEGNYHNVPANLEQTMDSGYIITGTTSKYGTEDAYIMKLNSCFEKEWCKVLYTTNINDYGRKVKPLPDGGYLLLTAYYEGLERGKRINLHKFDTNGELIWQNSYAHTDTLLFGEEGFDLTIINDNEYLITGECYYPNPGQYGGWIRPLLIKVNSSGTEYWETIWGKTNYYYGNTGYSIANHLGDFYSVGMHIGENGQFPSLIKTSNYGQEIFYSDLIDTNYYGMGGTIVWTEDSLIYTCLAYQNVNSPWHWGFFIIDTVGTILNFREMFSPEVSIRSTIRTFNNKFLSIGVFKNEMNRWVIYAYKLNSELEYDTLYTAPFVYDSLCPYEISSDTTDLDCDILVLVDEQFVPLNEIKMKIYPNPARDKVTISYPDVMHSGNREIIFLNSLGVEVKRIRLMKGDEETEADIGGLLSGIYFVVMMDNGNRVAEGKMLVAK